MSLFANEVWIGQDISTKIACEEILDSSCNLDLFWSDNGEFSPFSCKLVSDPEESFIDSSSFSFNIWSKFALLLCGISDSLRNIIISISS